MPVTRIRDLYVVELSELYETEQEILRQLPLMAAHANDERLRDLFESHYRSTYRHVDRLTEIFERLDERRRPSTTPAVRGLVEEARLRQTFLDRGDLLDLALVDACRRIEHYEIAAYSAAVAYATRLGDGASHALLAQTLDEERRMDAGLEVITSPRAPGPRVTAA